jgi:potassium voltage-gated channel Eag-related subfamily H protein 8
MIQQNSCHTNTYVGQRKIDYCPNSIYVVPIIENEVESVIKNLKGKFSVGYDEIPEYVVKHCASFIRGPLTHIYNMSIKSGIFPEKFKIARLKPLYKKGDIQNMQNYRPISVLSVFSKILKKLIYNRLIMFLKKHNILTEAQNGFREKKCTDTAIQSFIERIHEAWATGNWKHFLLNKGI